MCMCMLRLTLKPVQRNTVNVNGSEKKKRRRRRNRDSFAIWTRSSYFMKRVISSSGASFICYILFFSFFLLFLCAPLQSNCVMDLKFLAVHKHSFVFIYFSFILCFVSCLLFCFHLCATHMVTSQYIHWLFWIRAMCHK